MIGLWVTGTGVVSSECTSKFDGTAYISYTVKAGTVELEVRTHSLVLPKVGSIVEVCGRLYKDNDVLYIDQRL